MESGFQQDVVSSAGAVGVMQLLPETWEWVDTLLLGEVTPRDVQGNVRAGVRYLRWQLDQFGGDTKLALAGYYQGARAVRERGLFEDTKQYVSVILQLYGSVYAAPGATTWAVAPGQMAASGSPVPRGNSARRRVPRP